MSEPTVTGRRDDEALIADVDDIGSDGTETVGQGDVMADAARSGVDVPPGALDDRDSSGEAVGAADVEADMRRTGADTD